MSAKMTAPKLLLVFAWVADHSHYFNEELDDVELTGVNQLDWHGDCPLHVVARAGRVDDICVLLDSGADINAKGDQGMTPLHNAVMNGHVNAICTLRSRGAALSVKDDDGRTALDWAITASRKEIILALS
jgi:uncharacterized protein